MKKLISLLLSILLTVTMLPLSSYAWGIAFTSNVPCVDFFDYTNQTTYKTYFNMNSAFEAVTATDSDGISKGKSLHIYNKMYPSSKTPVMNLRTLSSDDIVLGFSYFTKDTQAQFSVFTKGSSGSWDTGSVSSMVVFKGGNISVKKGNDWVTISSDGLGKWTDVAIVMDYKSQADIYVNGVLKGSRSFNSSIVDTDYFGFDHKYPRYTDEADAEAQSKYASFYFDDMYVYKSSSAMASTVLKENAPVNYKTTEATVDFGQNLILSDSSAIEVNGRSVDYDLIEKYGFVTGVKLKNLNLSGNTEYTVSASGFKTLFGGEYSDTLTFTTSDDSPSLSITHSQAFNETAKHPYGTKLTFNIESMNLNPGNDITVYKNDKVYSTLSYDTTSFDVELTEDVNEIYLAASSNGKSCESNKLTALAIEYSYIKAHKFQDYTGAISGTLPSETKVEKAEGDWSDLKVVTKNGNTYIEVNTTDTTFAFRTVGDGLAFSSSPQAMYVFEIDMMFPDITKVTRPISPKFHTDANGGSKMITNFGTFIQNGKVAGTDISVQANKWYKFKFIYDFESSTRTVSLYMDNKPVKCNQQISSSYTPLAFTYMTHYVNAGEKLCIDNVNAYFVTHKASLSASYGAYSANTVPYENGKLGLLSDFMLDALSLKEIPLKDSTGNKVVDISFVASDGSSKAYTANLPKLNPKTSYTLDLSNVKTKYNAACYTSDITFVTDNTPFCIESIELSESANSVNAALNIRNNTESVKKSHILVGVFCGKKLLETKYVSYDSQNSETKNISFVKPSGEYEIRAYMLDSLSSLNLIDECSKSN